MQLILSLPGRGEPFRSMILVDLANLVSMGFSASAFALLLEDIGLEKLFLDDGGNTFEPVKVGNEWIPRALLGS